jgi:predicted Zn-dependent peptidase
MTADPAAGVDATTTAVGRLVADERLAVLDARPTPGEPRTYHFPAFTRSRLDDGLELVRAHVPGRPLLQAQLIVRGDAGGGAASEDPARAGASVLAARALPEGTAKRDGIELVEAAERLGAELGADAGWDSAGAHVEVPRTRLGPALALLAEMALQPSFPEREVLRLRDERLNDLKQAMADPRRRAEKAFAEAVYPPDAAYARSLGGSTETVADLDRDAVVARHAESVRPDACTLIVCGDLTGVEVEDAVRQAFVEWPTADPAPDGLSPAPDTPHRGGARVVVVDRPGAPQSEVRVGHVGLPRVIPDFHAVSVMNTILGGLFNSRLNRLLREERGYTYGVHSGFDLRRAAGPFAVRCAVETDVTAPAVIDLMAELRRIRDGVVEDEELATARDYLVGVFPLRFETSAQVAGALGGIVVYGLPDDELDRYRPEIAAVTPDEIHAAATAHLAPDRAVVVIVGDAARIADPLRDAGLGEVEVVRDENDAA